MPTYQVTDNATGRKFKLTGDSPPSEQELEEIFSQQDVPRETIGRGNNPAGDVLANVLSGTLAAPVSGLAGIAGTLLPGEEGQGARFQQSTQKALTSDLKTQGGQDFMRGIGELVNKFMQQEAPGKPQTGFTGLENFGKAPVEEKTRTIGEALEAPSEAAFEAGGPLAGTIAKTLPIAIMELLPLKGMSQTRKAAMLKEQLKETPIPEGALPEFSKAISDQGLKPAEILDQKQLDSLQRFSELDTAPTRGELNKSKPEGFAQLKEEQALLESANDPSGDAFRATKLEQSARIRESVNKQVDALGVPDGVGDSIKDALSSRKAQLKSTRRAAYEGFAEATKGSEIPLITSNLLEGLPDTGTMRTIFALNPSGSSALKQLLGEFDLQKAKEGSYVTPLSLQNFDGFRKRLNAIDRSDQTGQMGVIIGPIRKSLDEEIELAFRGAEASKSPDISILSKEARQSHANLKTEFDEKGIVDKLISNKRKSNIPAIENSEVYQKLASKSLPVEQVERLVNSLSTQGSLGKKALGDLQSAMLLDLIDSAYGASSRQIQGVRTFGGAAFQKRYQVLEPKLDIIFKDNPRALQRIKNLSKTAEDLTPPHGAVPKGSAGFLIDIAQGLGLTKIASMIPGGRAGMEGLVILGQRAKSRESFDRAVKLNPELKKNVEKIKNDYPSLALALGIGAIATEEEQ